MKTSNLISAMLCSAISFSVSVTALGKSPLLSKSNIPGFVMPADVIYQTCEIYSDRVVYKHDAAGIQVTESKPISLDAAALLRLQNNINVASQANIEVNEVVIADAPETWWRAYSNGRAFVLKGDVSDSIDFDYWFQMNTSPEARTLINLINALCR